MRCVVLLLERDGVAEAAVEDDQVNLRDGVRMVDPLNKMGTLRSRLP